ncbi:glycosyltransferase family 2 protein [Aliiroseovarius crassostreae]|uniref:glycosyltransferase family 2 protein n=1 Tax=Aliiroseovarius crassostreae TaxID=154981 RepID=UPI00220BC8F4|nr:glycosyltransferase family 2 protein [Aliiroseovarius crassostreae]UWQ01609.1 glycosyltransferase family 2 protein [Aliiroseovarius crassostreae]
MTGGASSLWSAYRMRLKRRRLLFRSLRSRRQLTPVADRTGQIRPGQILSFTTLRNEIARLPFFLSHYRKMGVDHFLIVANDCDDGSVAFLADQPDVSLWQADDSYKAARFGVDWLTWLQFRHGHGHWCLTADADELLIYPHWDTHGLKDLTHHLDQTGAVALGALMLDLYPKGAIGQGEYRPGQDPTEVIEWFDPGPYRCQRQPRMQNLWVQGGARERVFFATQLARGPTLNKLPLVKWNRRYAYANSSHSLLPPQMNLQWDGPESVSGDSRLSGVLLHTKFLPGVLDRSSEEKGRKEHFGQPDQFDAYYNQVVAAPDLWCDRSVRYQGWQQLEALGLMSSGNWDPGKNDVF